MSDDLPATRYLQTPLGQRGSGRVRYGAAMALWQTGRITAQSLEMYRVAAAHDGHDVAGLHWAAKEGAENDLSLAAQEKDAVLRGLYGHLRDYLLGLTHAGAPDVRAGLPVEAGPIQAIQPQQTDCVRQWLGLALGHLRPSHPVLADAIAAAAPLLHWGTYDAYPPAQIGADFASGHAFASVLGGDAPFVAHDFDMGLFLIAPNILYRDHAHAAPELYAPLTGPHGWRFGIGRPLIIKAAHRPIWNPPHRPHLTKTGACPFLAVFVWTKDVASPAQVLPADDWPQLEAAHLD